MKRIIRTILAALVISAVVSPATATAEYAVGQVWNYKTRKGEEDSKIVIAKIDENEKLGRIYHLYIEGIKLKTPNGIQNNLPHSPVSKKTLDASVKTLVETRQSVPDITEGYNTWKQAFYSGQGGVFDIPVAKIIEYVESVVNQSQKEFKYRASRSRPNSSLR